MTIKINCKKCHKLNPEKQIYKLTWRYTDKEKEYIHSKRKMIHTGRLYLCKKCLNKIIIE